MSNAINDTIKQILLGIDIDTADAIASQAAQSARILREQGWQGGGASYDVGVYAGDMNALETLLGRETTRDERFALEKCIRAHLDATA